MLENNQKLENKIEELNDLYDDFQSFIAILALSDMISADGTYTQKSESNDKIYTLRMLDVPYGSSNIQIFNSQATNKDFSSKLLAELYDNLIKIVNLTEELTPLEDEKTLAGEYGFTFDFDGHWGDTRWPSLEKGHGKGNVSIDIMSNPFTQGIDVFIWKHRTPNTRKLARGFYKIKDDGTGFIKL